MNISRQYNIEIFSPKFEYRDSFQIGTLKYKYDYTDVEKNSIESPIATKVSIADYIRIHSQGSDILGIILISRQTRESRKLSSNLSTSILMWMYMRQSWQELLSRF